LIAKSAIYGFTDGFSGLLTDFPLTDFPPADGFSTDGFSGSQTMRRQAAIAGAVWCRILYNGVCWNGTKNDTL
jgi:hypothetical protein